MKKKRALENTAGATQAPSFVHQLLALQQQKKDAGEVARLRGNEFYAQGEFESALQCYTSAIETYPADPASYSNRAMVNLVLGRYEQVIADAN